MLRGRRPLVAVALALAVLAAACGGSSSSDSPGAAAPDPSTVQQGGASTVLQPVDATSLDPALVISSPSQGSTVLNAIYDALYGMDTETGEFEPRIATEFTTEDGLTWTMTLREGVTFTDGTPLDADAVKFNWERTSSNPRSISWSYGDEIESMTALDPTTFQVVLSEPNFEFRWMPVWSNLLWIASPTAVQAAGDGYGTTAVGAGPFRIDRRTPNSETVLVRNETYWQEGLPKLDTLTLRTVLDPQQAYDTLTTGGADAWVSVPEQYAVQVGDAGYHLVGPEQVGGTGWLMGNRAPFDDIRARQAVYLAADMEALNDVVANGAGNIPTTFLPESSPYHAPDITFPEPDPVEAQRLLDELAAEGTPVSFTIVTAGGDSQTRAVALQTQLTSFDNLDVSVEQLDPSTYGITLYQGQFDMAVFGIGGGHAEPVIASFRTTHKMPIANMGSETIDALVAESRAASDEESRKDAYDRLQQEIVDRYKMIWMGRNHQWLAMSSDVTGMDSFGQGTPVLENFGRVG